MRKIAQRGFSLVEVMIAGVVVMAVLLGMASIMSQLAKQKIGTNVSMDAQMLRQNVMQFLQNDVSWAATILDKSNRSLKCILEVSDCTEAKEFAAGQWLRLFDPSGKLVQDTALPMAGFSESGRPCGNFPSVACPFRVDVLWRAVCAKNPPCLLPQIEVQAKVIRNIGAEAGSPGAGIPFNPENYMVRVYRPSAVLGLSAPSPSPSPSTSDSAGSVATTTSATSASGGGNGVNVTSSGAAPSTVTLPMTPAVNEQVQKFTKELCAAMGDAVAQPGLAEELRQRFESMGLGSQESAFFAKSFQTSCQQNK